MITDDRDAKGARAQQIRGAIAVHANQVRHHVGGAPFGSIHQQRHPRGVALRRGRLGNDRVRRIL